MSIVESQAAIDALRKAIKETDNVTVLRALRKELVRLERARNGVGKHRKVKTTDGALVGVGDTVYSYSIPYTPTKEYSPKVTERVIVSITRGDNVNFENSYRSITLAQESYYSSWALARKAMIAKLTAAYNAERARCVAHKRNLALARVLKPVPSVKRKAKTA